MKKIFIVLLFYCCTTHFIFATDAVPEKLIYQDSVLLFSMHNNQVVIITQVDDNRCLLSVNDKTDTLNFAPQKWRNIETYYNRENVIYFTDNMSDENVFQLNLDSRNITKIKTFANSYTTFIVDDYMIRSCDYDCEDDACIALLSYNMYTDTTDTLYIGNFDFSDFIIGNKILIRYFETGSVYGFGYYDWNNKKFVENLSVLDTMKFEIFINDKGEKYVKHDISDLNYAYTDITGKYSNIGLYWVDGDFNLIQPTLQSYTNTQSTFNVGADSSYYYRSSVIKDKKSKRVWVACKFTLAFDKALYNIYNDTSLSKSDVEKFDKWELNKLRNMIFAKHGYQFQSEYLQAFFNLFDFYNNIKKTNDVNNLLTPTDRKNLQLIQQINKMKEKNND
jgi:hypothetical protein